MRSLENKYLEHGIFADKPILGLFGFELGFILYLHFIQTLSVICNKAVLNVCHVDAVKFANWQTALS